MRDDNMSEKRRRSGKRPLPPRARRAVRRRVRPAVRAAKRRAKAGSRPMPAPPPRRPLRPASSAAAKAAAPNPELAARVQELQSRFADLEGKAQLGGVYNAIGTFDAQLVELPLNLESLRNRGYVHSEQLEDRLEALEERWDETRPRVETALQEQVARLDQQLDDVERHVHRLRPAEPALNSADSVLRSLSQRIEAAETAVAGLYDGMETELYTIQADLSKVAAMMELFEASPHIQLRDTEGPLLAVKSEWHRDGDEGPAGVLLLTDQRLLFEQRQEVVTKKRLGIFKAESEMIRELLLEIEVMDIDAVEHKEEGGFLGMGKDDIIEFVFSANAPISRGRFHLQGQDSAAWSTMIMRAKTGEIDEDRADEYIEELEAASEMALSFPTECPNCLAALPPPPRGVTSVACEFCGAVIKPA